MEYFNLMKLKFFIIFCLSVALFPSLSQAEERWIMVVNETDRDIKVVAPGGGGFVKAQSKPTKVTVNNDEANGDFFLSWWTDNPRQICKIYTRWQGTLYLNGETEIRCRAH